MIPISYKIVSTIALLSSLSFTFIIGDRLSIAKKDTKKDVIKPIKVSGSYHIDDTLKV